MSKIVKTFLVVLTATALLFVSAFAFGGSTAYAETETETTGTTETPENATETEETGEGEELPEGTEEEAETPAETPETEEETGATETETETGTETETEIETDSDVAASFLEYLKSVYPTNYDYYYNLVIDNWGSVEEYLLSVTDYLPESAQNSWESFVGWLSEYASIWATILAILAAVIFAYLQWRRTQKYKAQYETLTEASNQQTTALMAVISAQKSLLGNNEKFSEEVTALEKATEELNKNV